MSKPKEIVELTSFQSLSLTETDYTIHKNHRQKCNNSFTGCFLVETRSHRPSDLDSQRERCPQVGNEDQQICSILTEHIFFVQ